MPTARPLAEPPPAIVPASPAETRAPPARILRAAPRANQPPPSQPAASPPPPQPAAAPEKLAALATERNSGAPRGAGCGSDRGRQAADHRDPRRPPAARCFARAGGRKAEREHAARGLAARFLARPNRNRRAPDSRAARRARRALRSRRPHRAGATGRASTAHGHSRPAPKGNTAGALRAARAIDPAHSGLIAAGSKSGKVPALPKPPICAGQTWTDSRIHERAAPSRELQAGFRRARRAAAHARASVAVYLALGPRRSQMARDAGDRAAVPRQARHHRGPLHLQVGRRCADRRSSSARGRSRVGACGCSPRRSCSRSPMAARASSWRC